MNAKIASSSEKEKNVKVQKVLRLKRMQHFIKQA